MSMLATDSHAIEKPPQVEKPISLRVSTDVRPEQSPSEICLSPSWSDHGEKTRKKDKRKAEKERKEREKNLRQDDDRQKMMDLKAGKRLSKRPPPAAMETQKMPISLRRNSWISFMSSQTSSGENSRRSSRDERRLSGVSLLSTNSKRSRSSPGTTSDSVAVTPGASEQWHPIVSPSAPKLPSFRWSTSRKNGTDQTKSASSESGEAYEKEFIAFAYLDGHVNGVESQAVEQSSLKQCQIPDVVHNNSPIRPALSKSATEPAFMNVPYGSVSSTVSQKSPGAKSGSPENRAINESDRSHPGWYPPRLAGTNDQISLHYKFQSQGRPSNDGSSYVHKQRMYQQQQSIAGFEDQQAVKHATEAASALAAEYEALVKGGLDPASEECPPSKLSKSAKANQHVEPAEQENVGSNVTPIYTKQRDRSISPHGDQIQAKDQLDNPILVPKELTRQTINEEQIQKENQEQRPTKPVGNSTNKSQQSAGLKTDKILGFRRRVKQPPAPIDIVDKVENQQIAVTPSSQDDKTAEDPAVQESKIGRLFREPKLAFAGGDQRSSSPDSRNRAEEALSGAKSQYIHSRTPSTVPNNDMNSLLPKSMTEPTMDEVKRSTGQSSRFKDGQDCTRTTPAQSEADLHIPNQRQSQSEAKAHRESSSSVSAKSRKNSKSIEQIVPIEDTTTGDKPGKTQTREFILTSETRDGLARQTSIKRPRSNPQLQIQTPAVNRLPTLDFLPPLKHQPLIKRERQSPTRPAPTESGPVTISHFQEPMSPLGYESPVPPDLKLIPRSPLRNTSKFPVTTNTRFNRSATDVGTVSFGQSGLIEGVDAKPVAKMFVICCKCKFWHDLPSKLYEAMALPLELHQEEKGKMTGARLETAVKCSWCEHAMTTRCCQGWTTVVYLHERHH